MKSCVGIWTGAGLEAWGAREAERVGARGSLMKVGATSYCDMNKVLLLTACSR